MANYECENCKKQLETEKDAPECCGKPMMMLPVCESTSTAEHARADSLDDACDDGRSGS